MGLEKIFGKCDEFDKSFIGNEVDDFITVEDAAKSFHSRLNTKNDVHGHIISFEKLEQFVEAIRTYNNNPSQEEFEQVEYVRIWNGSSTKYGTCASGPKNIEDLIFMPTFASGVDAFANDNHIVEQYLKVGDKPAILSEVRPCPKWCGNPDGITEGAREYFHQRYTESAMRSTTQSYQTFKDVNPYENICD